MKSLGIAITLLALLALGGCCAKCQQHACPAPSAVQSVSAPRSMTEAAPSIEAKPLADGLGSEH